MPHIIVEHNIEDNDVVQSLCGALHDELCGAETVKPEAVKTRALKVQNLILGLEDDVSFFVHVTLKLLPGRDDDLKKKMTGSLLKVLEGKLGFGSFSVEAMELESYTKL
jgi:5-carboxymethyl-2-hydroxymuconate isomerase